MTSEVPGGHSLTRQQIAIVRDRLDAVCDEARLGKVDRNLLTTRQFLNPSIFEGVPAAVNAG